MATVQNQDYSLSSGTDSFSLVRQRTRKTFNPEAEDVIQMTKVPPFAVFAATINAERQLVCRLRARLGTPHPDRREDMEIVSATQSFEHAERVDLTLTKRDGQKQPTGMIVVVVLPVVVHR
jgi:hypothetical protein